jgi:hypothetical protein
MPRLTKRQFLLAATGGTVFGGSLTPIVVEVNALMDQGAHSGKGLSSLDRLRFQRLQEAAAREFAISGIRFNVHLVEGAFLRTQGYSDIPDKFLSRGVINLLVTEKLAYDIDRYRTGGCSIGPRPRTPGSPPDPFYKTFLLKIA